MSTLHVRERTHQGVLPQLLALESVPADNAGVATKRGTDAGPVPATGAQHGRGESLDRDRQRAGRHRDNPEAGGDPGTPPPAGQRVTQPRVLVLDKRKKPLMPTSPKRAKELLRFGRARVHKMYPFTIRLSDRTIEDSEVEGVTVKIDPGSRYTGIEVARTDVDGTVHGLAGIEVRHRGRQIHLAMTARAQLRRGRRSRNLRYRAPRFNNRRRPDGWLPPSLLHRVEPVMAWVTRLRKLAPVTSLTVEAVRFDTQALQNPEITGVQYQQGTLAGYEVREYLLLKWGRRCAYCDATDVPLNIDHIVPRSRGGSHRVSNLTISCAPCNQAKDAMPVRKFVTDPKRLAAILAQAQAPLQDAAAVNATRRALFRALADTGLPVESASGGCTKWNRARNGVPKSHTLDALCAGEVSAIGSWPARALVATSTGRGSYSRTRSDAYGFPRLHLTRTKRHHGFATGDLVRAIVPAGAKKGVYTGRVAVRKTGSFNITTRDGTVQGISHRHCRLTQRADGWRYHEQEEANHAG
jgi:5-methylcytosine-specific restriction endonuclease McrA